VIKANKQTSVRTHRKFDETFKRQAVANWLSSGKSAEVIAQELGIYANLLYAWRKRFAPQDARRAAQGAKPGSVADLQAQLDAARRELAHVREQRDILKKTLGILSDPQPNATNGSTR
jgi:transposase